MDKTCYVDMSKLIIGFETMLS